MFISHLHILWTRHIYTHTSSFHGTKWKKWSIGRGQSTYQERICCFIKPHQKKAVSGLKMERKFCFYCREQKDGEKENVVRGQWLWSEILSVQTQHFWETGHVTVTLILHRNEAKYFCYWMLLAESWLQSTFIFSGCSQIHSWAL